MKPRQRLDLDAALARARRLFAPCRSFSRSLCLRVALGATVALAAALPGTAGAAATDVASLYGPQPPVDAAYLRVLNAAAQPAAVTFSGGTAQTLAPNAVTRFGVLRAGEPLRVSVAGQAVRVVAGSLGPATAGAYVTVALQHDAKGWSARAVATREERLDGLKATLHVLNFAPGCQAGIALAGGGASVFSGVAEGAGEARAINPVSAALVGQCGAASSAPLTLPPLAAGDGYSLFVLGTAARPLLVGARDALLWPPAAH